MPNHQETLNNRKRRRKNKRISGIESSSNCLSTRNDDLETAKAAAIKLLDHSSQLNWCVHPTTLIDQELVLSPSQVIKKTRFRVDDLSPSTSTSINRLTEDRQHESKSQQSHPVLQSAPIDTPSKHLKPNLKVVNSFDPSSLSGSQSTATANASKAAQHSPSTSTTQNLKIESIFHVTREEVFADNAIGDAFQAAMNEFNFFRRLDTDQGGIGVEGGERSEFESIKLPQSSIEQRRVSALYYGQPPSHAVVKTKKPRLDTIFLPRLTVPSNPVNKQSDAIEEKGQDVDKSTCKSARRRGSQSSGSDLDMDDYWDMMGSQSDDASVSVDDEDNDQDEDNYQEEEHDEDNDKDELQVQVQVQVEKEEKETAPSTSLEKDGKILIQNNRSTSETNSSIELESKSTRSTTTDTNATQMINSSTSSIQINGGTRAAGNDYMSIDTLTDSQKILISNALNAQYWAGYHTAVLNQSLGINLENLPILVPQIDNNNNHHRKDNSLSSFSSANLIPNFPSLPSSTSQS